MSLFPTYTTPETPVQVLNIWAVVAPMPFSPTVSAEESRCCIRMRELLAKTTTNKDVLAVGCSLEGEEEEVDLSWKDFSCDGFLDLERSSS